LIFFFSNSIFFFHLSRASTLTHLPFPLVLLSLSLSICLSLLTQNNAAFDAVARAGGPKVSDFLSGPQNDLKKLLLFHVAEQKLTPEELTQYKIIQTKLPGAKLKVVQAAQQASGGEEPRSAEIQPASYDGKAAGQAGVAVAAGDAAILPINAVLAPGMKDIQAAV